jgi:hypothetical protein
VNRCIRAGVALLLITACLRAVGYLLFTLWITAPEQRWASTVARYDGPRFAGLAGEFLPGQLVGYVQDDPEETEIPRPYYLAQYVLAPVILIEDTTPPLVVLNGRPGGTIPPAVGKRPLLRDLGDGVRLFGPEKP